MRACVRLDDGMGLECFAVEQGQCQSCVFAPLLFNIFFAAVTHVAYTRFEADEGIMDALVGLRKNAGARRRGETTSGEPAPATHYGACYTWAMLESSRNHLSSSGR